MATNRKLTEKIFGAEENSAAKMDPEKLGQVRDIAEQMYNTPVLSTKERWMPALARAGREISGLINGSYQKVFFVSVLRLDMLYVTIIVSLIGIYDVLNNPLMGIAYDRTRTRWGKARPYAFLSPIFYFGSTALLYCGALFFNNDNTADPRKILFVFIVMFLQETFSTIYTIPTDNYLTLMSPNPDDRIAAGLWNSFMPKWIGNFAAGMIVPLMDFARSGFAKKITQAHIFAGFGIVSAIIGIGGSFSMTLNCRERIILQPKPAPMTKTIFYILKNKYAMRNFLADLGSGWWSTGGYNWDYVFQLEILGGFLRATGWYMPRNIFNVASIAFVKYYKKFFGGNFRKTIIMMRCWDMAFGLGSSACALFTNEVNTWWKVGLEFAITDGAGVSNDAPATVMEDEIKREITDYTEYVTGERPDGTINLLTDLVKKTTAGISALMTMAMFRWSGYDPNVGSNKRWSQELVRRNSAMYKKAYFLYRLGNIPQFIFNLIPMIMYDLEGKKKEDMYAALNERRALIARQAGLSAEMEALVEAVAAEESN